MKIIKYNQVFLGLLYFSFNGSNKIKPIKAAINIKQLIILYDIIDDAKIIKNAAKLFIKTIAPDVNPSGIGYVNSALNS